MEKGETVVNNKRVLLINCRQVWREISDYLDDSLDAGLRARMEAHFKNCSHCTAILDGTRNIILLVGDERAFQVPEGFGFRLRKRLESQIGDS